ncbi:hypothetical protein [[Phormidium] sp. ETS-05]|uniref:hypothetical protein n=1 Tax=[Phormidium] sp. ETS-05 TaxID=222819 RepID=UPI0018EF13ED|nr:hypothetical protein [[Phormidium] sp. ETS-05]
MTNLAYIYGRTFSIIHSICQVGFGVKGFWGNFFGKLGQRNRVSAVTFRCQTRFCKETRFLNRPYSLQANSSCGQNL